MHRTLILMTMIMVTAIPLASCGMQQAGSLEPTPALLLQAPAERVLVLGNISEHPAEDLQVFQPFADYLAAHLAIPGLVIKVKIAPDLATMARWMQSGEVDLYCDSPYPAMIVSDRSGAQPILRRWKGGVAEYKTVFFARKDSAVASLDNLRGHMLGLEESFSTSGYFLPVTYLLRASLPVAEKPVADAAVGPNEVGYIFTQDHTNTIQWVLSGKVLAGAVDQHAFDAIPEAGRANLSIFAETETVARHVLLVRQNLDSTVQDAVIAALVAMDKTPDGQAALLAFEETTRFDAFPTVASLTHMRELYQLVKH